MSSSLVRLEDERACDERGAHIRRMRSQSGRRAVHFSTARKSETGVSFFSVSNWIFHSGFAKAFEPQETGIAFAAGKTVRCRIVTAVGKRKIDAELDCFANDVGLRKFDERRVNLKASAFDAGFCSKVSEGFERLDEFWSAIGVAAVVDRVYTDENISGRDYFRQCKRVSEKDRVTRGNIGDRNSVRDFCFRTLLWHIDIISKRRAAEDAHIDFGNAMFLCA